MPVQRACKVWLQNPQCIQVKEKQVQNRSDISIFLFLSFLLCLFHSLPSVSSIFWSLSGFPLSTPFSLLPPTLPAIHPSFLFNPSFLCFSFSPVSSTSPISPFHLPSLPPSAYKWIHGELRGNIPLQYLAWVSYPLMFILFSSLFCHLVAPQAIGLYPLLHMLFSCFSVLICLLVEGLRIITLRCILDNVHLKFSLQCHALWIFGFLLVMEFWKIGELKDCRQPRTLVTLSGSEGIISEFYKIFISTFQWNQML